MEYRQKEIQLTLCEKCNLNCIYCYEHNKDHNVMPFDLAQKIIIEEFRLAKENGTRFLKFYFHGGEVCLVFDLLRAICEWMWSRKWEVPYICNATTNGTLVHGSIKKWFQNNSNRFILGLSLDGNKTLHNINRNNSYDLIDLDFFKNAWPKQDVKMTISPQTVHGLCDGIVDIVSKGFSLSANLAYGCDWQHEDLKYQYAKELLNLSEYFLCHLNMEPPKKLLNKWLVGLGRLVYLREQIVPRKQCGTGSGMCCYDMYGNKYPCQMFMPSASCDYKYEGCVVDERDICYSQECKECPIVSICPTCYGSNFVQYGELVKKKDGMCDFYRIEILNYSFFLYKMLKSKDSYFQTRNLSDVEIALSIEAIVYIQRQLRNTDIYKYIV